VKHALVIEDNILIAMMIEGELVASGYDSVAIAGSQEAAIRAAEIQCPELITADEKLDDGSGIAAIRHICRDRTIPVVFVVAEASELRGAIPQAVVLLKPFADGALSAAVATSLASSQASTTF
jgi:CheY-like chemotaxis protein